jgi:hypothetical protein
MVVEFIVDSGGAAMLSDMPINILAQDTTSDGMVVVRVLCSTQLVNEILDKIPVRGLHVVGIKKEEKDDG